VPVEPWSGDGLGDSRLNVDVEACTKNDTLAVDGVVNIAAAAVVLNSGAAVVVGSSTDVDMKDSVVATGFSSAADEPGFRVEVGSLD